MTMVFLESMGSIEQLKVGFMSYVEATKFIVRHKLYWYFLVPTILGVGIYYLGHYFKELEAQPLEADPESLNDMVWTSLRKFFEVTMFLVFTKFTKYLVLILLSPVLSILSEKVEEILTSNTYPFNWKQLLKDIRRGVQIAVRNMIWEYTFLVALVIVGSVVGGAVEWAVAVAVPFIIGFYFQGFGFLDYVNERRRLNVEQSVFFVRRHRALAMAIGCVFSLTFLIPYVGVVIAPIFAMVAATIGMNHAVDLSQNRFAVKKAENAEVESSETTEQA